MQLSLKALSTFALVTALGSFLATAAPISRLQPRNNNFIDVCDDIWLSYDTEWGLFARCRGAPKGMRVELVDGEVKPIVERMNLGSCVASKNGKLQAWKEGHMSDACWAGDNFDNCKVEINREERRATLKCTCAKDWDSGMYPTEINLNDIIGSEDGKLVCHDDIWSISA